MVKAGFVRSPHGHGRRLLLGAPPTVLGVEDDALYAELLRVLLARAGYAMAHAPVGAAALRYVKAGGIVLVLLDLMLPDVDGLDVCRRLRARPDEAYLPIIMLTVLPDEAQRRA